MKKLLVSGAGGFVGARIMTQLAGRYELCAFPKGMLAAADEQTVADWVRRKQPDVIVHTAALSDTGYSEKAYYIYSTYLAQTHIHNDDGAPLTVLVFKDSYGTPLGAFLSLTVRDTYAVDLRSTRLTMEECVAKVNPDVVIFAYSQQTLREFSYDIAE